MEETKKLTYRRTLHNRKTVNHIRSWPTEDPCFTEWPSPQKGLAHGRVWPTK